MILDLYPYNRTKKSTKISEIFELSSCVRVLSKLSSDLRSALETDVKRRVWMQSKSTWDRSSLKTANSFSGKSAISHESGDLTRLLSRSTINNPFVCWSSVETSWHGMSLFVLPIINGCGASMNSIWEVGKRGTHGKDHLNGWISLRKHWIDGVSRPKCWLVKTIFDSAKIIRITRKIVSIDKRWNINERLMSNTSKPYSSRLVIMISFWGRLNSY